MQLMEVAFTGLVAETEWFTTPLVKTILTL
jgi:hypothetical protein